MVFLQFDLILTFPASPISLQLFPYPTIEGVCLRFAQLVIISTVPLSTAVILILEEPKSTPITEFLNQNCFAYLFFIIFNLQRRKDFDYLIVRRVFQIISNFLDYKYINALIYQNNFSGIRNYCQSHKIKIGCSFIIYIFHIQILRKEKNTYKQFFKNPFI